MPVPDIRQGVGADQVHDRIGCGQSVDQRFEIGHLRRCRAAKGLKGGRIESAHAGTFAFFTYDSRAVRAPGVMPSMRPA